MGKTVQLTLTGRQRDIAGDAGEETVTKSNATAEYYERNGALFLLYEEIPEQGAPAIHNRIKYRDNMLELTRKGTVSTRMVFECGKEHMADYATPYGCLQLGILTHSIETIPPAQNFSSPADRIIIRANYHLTAEGRPVSSCEIEIAIDFERM